MKKLVLTGAAGRLGSYLREPLSKMCDELVDYHARRRKGHGILTSGVVITHEILNSKLNTNH